MAKKVTERVIEIDAKGAENSIRALREEVRKLTEVQKDLDMESEEFRDISSELTAAQTKLRNAVQGNTAAVEGSYRAYSHQLQVLKEHRKWLAEGTEEYRKATEEISKLDQKLKQMDAEIGVHGRNVGNYSSAFDGLNQSVAQVTRELPSLTLGANQFFLAISNNLPILYDNIKGYQAMAKEGKTNVGVLGALGRALMSWNTLITIGITLLSQYGGKIVDWVKGLVGAKKKVEELSEEQKKYNEECAKFREGMSRAGDKVGEAIVLIRELRDEWESLGDNMAAKERFINDNTEAFDSLGVSITNVKDAERLLIEQTPQYIEALKKRALAEAAKDYAKEKYAEYVAAEVELALLDEQYPQPASPIGATSQQEMDRRGDALKEWHARRDPIVDRMDAAFFWADKAFEYSNAYNKQHNDEMYALGLASTYQGTGGSFESFLAQWYGVSPDKIAQDRAAVTGRRSGSKRLRENAMSQTISTLGAYGGRSLAIPALGGLAIDEGASIEANKARLAALTQMEGASAEERKAIEQSLQEELAFIEQMRLETHEMVLNEMLRSDELTADERIALEEELTANQVAQAELRAKAAEEQAKAEKKAAEEVMAIEKKKDDLKQQILKNSSSMLKDFASTLEDNTAEYKSIQSAAVVIDTIAAGMAGYKQGMTYGGPAAPFLAAFNLATAIATGAAQLHALWAVKPDGSNADSALSSAQVPNVASSMPASYTRNLMGDNELSELNKDTRVYVVEQDITDTQKKAKTREESASF